MRNKCIAFLLALPLLASAQNGHLKGMRVTTPPKIDGIIEDSEWGSVPFQETFYETGNNTPEPHRTRFWMAYDEKFVYFAARMETHEPARIVATETHTNGAMDGDDYFEIQIDPGGSLSEFNQFRINPLGTTRTRLAGGRAVKREWAGEISAKSRITGEGWEFEAAIPWQLMRLSSRKAIRNLRLNALRHVTAENRTYAWRFVTYDSRNYGYWDQVEEPAALVDRSIQLLPYVVGGYDPGKQPLDGGLDLRTKLNANLTAVGSINPDFRNVENAILSIDFSRFARIAAETRPFMLEGSQYLGGSAILATQSIPDFDVGAKLYGRLSDKASVGVLNATKFGAYNDTAAQYDVNWDDRHTSRFALSNFDSQGTTNKAALINYGAQISPLWYSFSRVLGSDDNIAGKGHEFSTQLDYGFGEWNMGLGYIQRSPGLLPRLGFLPNIDIRGYNLNANYLKNFEKRRLSQINLYVSADDYKHYHGGQYQRDLATGAQVVTSNQIVFTYNYAANRFEGVDDSSHNVGILFPANNTRTNASVNYTTGTANNDPYRNLSVTANAYLMRKLQLSSSYQKVHLFGADSDQLIVGGNLDLDDSHSIAGRVVKAGSDTNAYISYRRAGNTGTEFYLILGDPNATRTRGSVLLKVVWPLSIAR